MLKVLIPYAYFWLFLCMIYLNRIFFFNLILVFVFHILVMFVYLKHYDVSLFLNFFHYIAGWSAIIIIQNNVRILLDLLHNHISLLFNLLYDVNGMLFNHFGHFNWYSFNSFINLIDFLNDLMWYSFTIILTFSL